MSMMSSLRWVGFLLLALTGAALIFFTWQNFYPVAVAHGWSYQVVHRNVNKAASLTPQPGGDLLVSQELKDGQGSILRIAPDGSRQVIVAGLSKPDGMIAAQGGVVFSQEAANAPVSLLKQGQIYPLFEANNGQRQREWSRQGCEIAQSLSA